MAENKDLEFFMSIRGKEGDQQVKEEQLTKEEVAFAQWMGMPWTR